MDHPDWIKQYKISKKVVQESCSYHEIKDFKADNRFVLIKINKEKKDLIMGIADAKIKKDKNEKKYYEITHIIRGKKPQDIYHYVAKHNLLKLNEHYAYIGKELQKAYEALNDNKKYEQS